MNINFKSAITKLGGILSALVIAAVPVTHVRAEFVPGINSGEALARKMMQGAMESLNQEMGQIQKMQTRASLKKGYWHEVGHLGKTIAHCPVQAEKWVTLEHTDIWSETMGEFRCFEGFGVAYSVFALIPLAVAEELTPENIRAARKLPRKHDFHETIITNKNEYSKNIPRLIHYKGTGYDRGHMAPNGDMHTEKAQEESFGLVNIVPQNPKLNRGSWAKIESTLREYVVQENAPVRVVTGPGWGAKDFKERLHDYVAAPMIPTALWKAVYIPKYNLVGVLWVNNAAPKSDVPEKYEFITTTELSKRTNMVLNMRRESDDPKSLAMSFAEMEKKNPPSRWMPLMFQGLPH